MKSWRSWLWILLLVALVAIPLGTAAAYSGFPFFFIKEVNATEHWVEIEPHNFPPNDTFVVRMGPMGTRGVNGWVVGTVTTDASGNLSQTRFPIHPYVWDQYMVAIRLESPTSGYYAYNWFYNVTSRAAGSGSGGPAGYYGFPFFFIHAVEKDTSVTIKGYNFPPNDTFDVYMNYMGTRGVGGIKVATVTTDASGNLSADTFDIPPQLQGQYRIAIRLQSPTTGYYAYNWFYNTTATVPVP
ncbi:MAG: hypothetical protein GXO37_08180 [Chloroflexi bacterium]|nr:hypothetical protein [Chloroflexota bacterium]